MLNAHIRAEYGLFDLRAATASSTFALKTPCWLGWNPSPMNTRSKRLAGEPVHWIRVNFSPFGWTWTFTEAAADADRALLATRRRMEVRTRASGMDWDFADEPSRHRT